MSLALRRGEEELTHRLGRAPTPRELAAHLEVDVDDVLTAREALGARTSSSLDAPQGTAETSPIDLLGAGDEGFDHVDQKLVVAELLASLPEREQTVLQLRFGDNPDSRSPAPRSQPNYVSRLIRRTLRTAAGQLEDGRDEDDDGAPPKSHVPVETEQSPVVEPGCASVPAG
jgi:RNA polymerase sigma-B factor